MNKRFWAVYNNVSQSIKSTDSGAPVILPTRKYAREYANIANREAGSKSHKVVRVSFNLEHRLHDGQWIELS